MRPITPWLALGTVLLGLLGPAASPPAIAQGNAQAIQAVKQKALVIQTNYERFVTGQYTFASEVNVGARKVWAAALKVTGQNSTAGAGFSLPPLSSAGAMPGAKVTAKFVVSQAVGNTTKLFVRIHQVGDQGDVGQGERLNVSGPGTFVVSTNPITLQPGAQYIARAWVYAVAPGTQGEICAVVATIPEIKWEL